MIASHCPDRAMSTPPSSESDPRADDFIAVYPDALDRETCAAILSHFARSAGIERGATGGGVDTALKDSWDIRITGRDDWRVFHDKIQIAAFAGLAHYVRQYRYTLLAPLAIKLKNPATGALEPLDYDTLGALSPDLYANVLKYAFRPGAINVQKYLADQGGYPYWHCEHYPQANDADPLSRVLLYTIYLNDDFDEGETEFFYQRRRIVPRTGSLLIAPAFFTHTHRGNRPRGGDKYIATSWVLFNHASVLFAS
jgi:hypothetical protein